MFIIYNIFFILGFLILSPFFLYRLITSDRWREGLFRRFGIYPKEIRERLRKGRNIWINAASVGEVKAVTSLVRKIKEANPHHQIVFSTVTRTGNLIARNAMSPETVVIYFPLDFFFSVRRVISLIKPELFVLVESEIWPNVISQLDRRRIPMALINVRMSNGSFKEYFRARFFVKKIFSKFHRITAPSEKEASKIKALGVDESVIRVVGNLKFEKDGFHEPTPEEVIILRRSLGISEKGEVIIAGSTHAGEEAIITLIFQRMVKTFQDLSLILAPRHPERALEVARMVEAHGLSYQFRTDLDCDRKSQVLIVDTVGELERLYSIADIVFMGKSLTKKGGQNLLEPARFGKCIVFGPHMENFADIAALFMESRGAVQIQGARELEAILFELLRNRELRAEYGSRAREILKTHQGALQKNLDLLQAMIQVR